MDCNRPRILDIGRRRLGQQLFADIYQAQVTTPLALKSSAKRSFWPMRNLRDAQVCERVCIQSQPIPKYWRQCSSPRWSGGSTPLRNAPALLTQSEHVPPASFGDGFVSFFLCVFCGFRASLNGCNQSTLLRPSMSLQECRNDQRRDAAGLSGYCVLI